MRRDKSMDDQFFCSSYNILDGRAKCLLFIFISDSLFWSKVFLGAFLWDDLLHTSCGIWWQVDDLLRIPVNTSGSGNERDGIFAVPTCGVVCAVVSSIMSPSPSHGEPVADPNESGNDSNESCKDQKTHA